MDTYTTHHVAGRLRLKLAAMKGNERLAGQVEAAIGSVQGVVAVRTSTVTGSVLIHYDADQLQMEAIGDALQGAAAFTGSAPQTVSTSGPSTNVSVSPLAEKLAGVFIEQLISRSAAALVGALL